MNEWMNKDTCKVINEKRKKERERQRSKGG